MQELQEMWVSSVSWEDSLEEKMATHSSIFTWRIPRTEEPDGIQSMGSQRVWHNWMNRSRRRRNKHLLLSGNYFRNITVNKVFGLRELALDRHAWGVEEQFLLLLFSCPVVSEEQRNRKKKKQTCHQTVYHLSHLGNPCLMLENNKCDRAEESQRRKISIW